MIQRNESRIAAMKIQISQEMKDLLQQFAPDIYLLVPRGKVKIKVSL